MDVARDVAEQRQEDVDDEVACATYSVSPPHARSRIEGNGERTGATSEERGGRGREEDRHCQKREAEGSARGLARQRHGRGKAYRGRGRRR